MFLLDSTTPVVVMSSLEKWYYISQIIGTGILILSAYYARKQYEEQKKHSRIAKAADLAKHFKDSAIPSISKILFLFSKEASLKSIYDKIDLDKIDTFNQTELFNFISKNDLESFKAALSLKVSSIHPDISENEDMQFFKLTSRCLNDLEYFCINFNSNIADSDTVYQSLHQVFFEFMPVAYIFISSRNTSSANKYYTNIIAVYKKWREIYANQVKKELAFQKRYSNECDDATLVSPSPIK